MLKLLILGLILMVTLLGNGGTALATPAFGDRSFLVAQATSAEFPTTQIDQFAKAYEAVQAIQQAAEADMLTAVEDQDLTVDRFNEIAASQQQAEPVAGETVMTEAESDHFADAIEQIVIIRETAQVEMAEAIATAGLDVETFGQILTSARQDEALRQQISDRLTVESGS